MNVVEVLFPPHFPEWVNTGFSSFPRCSDVHLAQYVPAFHMIVQPRLNKKILATDEELSHANLQLTPVGTGLFFDMVESRPPHISLELEALVEGAFIALEFFSDKIRNAMEETRAELLDKGFVEEPFNPKALAAQQIASRIKKIVEKVLGSDIISYIVRPDLHLVGPLTTREIVAHTIIEMVLRTSLEDPLRSLIFLENADTSSFQKLVLGFNRSDAGMPLGNVHFRSHALLNYRVWLLAAKASQMKMSICTAFTPLLAPLMCHLDGTVYPVLGIDYGLSYDDKTLQPVFLGMTRKEMKFYRKTLHSLEGEKNCPLETWEMKLIDDLYRNVKKKPYFESLSFSVDEEETFGILGEYYQAQIKSLMKAFRDAIIKRDSHDCALCRIVRREIMDLHQFPSSLMFEKKFIDKISRGFREAFELYPKWVAQNLIPTIRSTFLANIFSTFHFLRHAPQSPKYSLQSSRCPCFMCPLSKRCGQGSQISPNKCEKLTEWIRFLAMNESVPEQ